MPQVRDGAEPMGIPSDDEGPNPELIDLKWRFWVGTLLTRIYSRLQRNKEASPNYELVL